MNKLWRAATGIFLVIWLVLMAGGRSRFFRDPGTFWHTVVGRQLLATRELIYHDTFSFTFAGERWIAHQWLGETIMAAIHDGLDGLDSLLLTTVSILACLYTWVAQRLIRSGLHWLPAGGIVALTIAASSTHFHVRPHIASIVLLGVTYGFLCDFEAGRIGLRRLWWLVPLFVLWTNIHGGMLGGLCTMGLAVAGWSLAGTIGWESPIASIRHLGLWIVLIVACGLTALVNPYGRLLPMTWLEIMDSPILPKIIVEHAPLRPLEPSGLMVLLFTGIYLAALIGVLPARPRVTWLIPLVWLYLGFSRVRHSPLFAITATVALADMLPATRWAQWLARQGSDLFAIRGPLLQQPSSSPRFLPFVIPATIVLLAFALQSARVPALFLGHHWARLDADYWPVDLEGVLAENQDRNPHGTPIFNELLFGGYLIYYTPDYRVFVDDRCELYGDRWLEDFVNAETRDTDDHMKTWESQYVVFNLALTRTGSGFDQYFSRNDGVWNLIKKSSAASLYERKK